MNLHIREVRIAKHKPPNLVLVNNECPTSHARPRPELNRTNLKRPNLKPHI
jgi:hypothetical protein